MTHNEAPLSVTFKPHGGYDAPLFTVRANDPIELVNYLNALAEGEAFDAMGRAQAALAAKFELGKGMGAVTEQAAPQQQAPVDHMAPTTPQPEWSTAPQQQAPAPVAPPQAAPGWGQPQQAAPAAAPAYATPPAPQAPPAGTIPGAPLIAGIPAKFIDKGSWKAFADPRPKQFTDAIPDSNKVNDPNHPGLAAGTHKFWQFVRN